MLYKGAIITDTGPGPGLMLAASLAPQTTACDPHRNEIYQLMECFPPSIKTSLVHWEGK